MRRQIPETPLMEIVSVWLFDWPFWVKNYVKIYDFSLGLLLALVMKLKHRLG